MSLTSVTGKAQEIGGGEGQRVGFRGKESAIVNGVVQRKSKGSSPPLKVSPKKKASTYAGESKGSLKSAPMATPKRKMTNSTISSVGGNSAERNGTKSGRSNGSPIEKEEAMKIRPKTTAGGIGKKRVSTMKQTSAAWLETLRGDEEKEVALWKNIPGEAEQIRQKKIERLNPSIIVNGLVVSPRNVSESWEQSLAKDQDTDHGIKIKQWNSSTEIAYKEMKQKISRSSDRSSLTTQTTFAQSTPHITKSEIAGTQGTITPRVQPVFKAFPQGNPAQRISTANTTNYFFDSLCTFKRDNDEKMLNLSTHATMLQPPRKPEMKYRLSSALGAAQLQKQSLEWSKNLGVEAKLTTPAPGTPRVPQASVTSNNLQQPQMADQGKGNPINQKAEWQSSKGFGLYESLRIATARLKAVTSSEDRKPGFPSMSLASKAKIQPPMSFATSLRTDSDKRAKERMDFKLENKISQADDIAFRTSTSLRNQCFSSDASKFFHGIRT